MTRRRGQSGTVVLKGEMWHGRYYEDVAGQLERIRRSVPIGLKSEMTKSQAKHRLMQILADSGVNTAAHLEKSVQPARSFKEAAEWYEENVMSTYKPSSRDSSHYIIKKHLTPRFGSMPVDSMTERTAQAWISDLQKAGTLAPKTIHNMWKVLKLIIGKPSRDWEVRLPEIPESEQRYFTPEEVQKIVTAAKGQYKVLFQLAFATGMRIGELLGLHVEDVDTQNNIVYVRRSAWGKQEVTPKSRAGYREIDVDAETIQMVKAHLGDRKAGRIFQTKNGTPLINGNIVKQVLGPICKRVGIPHGGMHAFRHGRVSILQQDGVPGDLIKKWVGHTSLKTTSRYTHFPEEFRKRIVEKSVRIGNKQVA